MDIASLAIQINTSDVSRAGQELDKLAGAGKKVEQATSGIAAAAKTDLGSAATTWKQFISERLSDYRKLEGGHAEAMRRIAAEWKQHRESFNSGLTPAQLGDATRAFTDNSEAMRQAGLSAGQYQQAIRMLPMQLTDVVTSLASGMPLWMVAIQQGGQVRDSFGGIGNAARAVVSTLGPMNLAVGGVAATLGTLLLAYQQGQNEAQAYKQALILTGNAAGTSADQLAGMAERIDVVSGTQHQAAAALAEIASTGKFTADQIEAIGTAAVAMENATGKAVSDTVKEFVRLADEPATASAKLNEQYRYLTASVYEQIAALEEQGRETEAAKLATDTFASAMQQRSSEIEGNLGTLERALNGLKRGWKEMWDAALDIGRPDTLEEKLEGARERLRNAQTRTGRQASRSNTSGIEQEIADIQLDIALRDAAAKLEENEKRSNQESISAQQKLNSALERTASNADKLKDRYKEIDEQVKAAAATGVIYSEAQIRQLREAAEKQFRDPAPRRQRAYTDDAATRLLQGLRDQEASLQAQLESTVTLSTAQRAQVEWAQQLADLKEKKILTAEQKSLLASQGQITAQLAENAALEAQIQARDRLAEQAQWMATLQERVGNRQNAADIAVQGVGLGDRARQELEQVNAIQREYARSREELARQQGTVNGLPGDQFQARIDALRAAEEQEIAILQEGAQRKKEAEGDWMNGAGRAWQNYLDEQASIATQSEQLFTSAFSGMEDALFGFVTTGKLGLQDLQRAFVGTALQMLIKWSVAQVSAAALNAFTSTAATPIVGPLAAPAAAASAASIASGFASQIASAASGFAGLFDKGGTIAAGQWGIAGEYGPEIIEGPARVVSRKDTARMFSESGSGNQGASGLNVVVNNYSNSRVETRQNRNGELEVIIRAVEDRLVGGIAAGDSRLGTVMERSYGMQRQGR